jgi:hypothetical protein
MASSTDFPFANLPTKVDAIQLSYRVNNLGHIPGRGVPIFWLPWAPCNSFAEMEICCRAVLPEAADSDDDAAAFGAAHIQHSFPNNKFTK